MAFEVGIYTFAEVVPGAGPGDAGGPGPRLHDLLEEARLADEVGLDVFAVGEHHRADYAVSAPATVLAAIAAQTRRIRLSSAVTVLSSDDPIRVFQAFSTVDLLSGGRAEIMAGRGSFTESFPLFGYELSEYDRLFEEKLGSLLEIRAGGRRGIYPRPLQDPLPVWIAVGGTPLSAARAGHLGLPLALAIIGGQPARFQPMIDIYREAGRRAGHPPERLRVGINSHTFVADTSAAAADAFFPGYAETMSRIGRERGWQPVTRPAFDAMRGPQGALVVGDVEEAVEKILFEHELFGNDRFLCQVTVGTTPHREVMRCIELLGTRVAPAVRAEVARRQGG